MVSRPSRISRNPLIRRIQRHTRLATLQRMADATAHAVYHAEGADRAGVPGVVKARLWVPLGPGEPQAGESPTLPQTGTPLQTHHTPAPAPVQKSQPLALPQATPQRPQPAISPQAGPVQRSIEHPAGHRPPPAAAAEYSTGRDSEDKNWRRLETIFRKHQEIENPQQPTGHEEPMAHETAPTVPDPGQPVSGKTVEVPASPPIRAAESGLTTGELSSPPQASPAVKQASSEPDVIKHSSEVINRGATREISQPSETGSVQVSPGDEIVNEAVVQRQPAPGQPAQEPSEPLSPAPAGHEPHALGDSALDSDYELPMQPLPLEAVWPVQTIQRAPIQRTESTEPAPDNRPAAELQEVETLRAALEQVAPGKSSESSVELIPPRRPRPLPPSSNPPVNSVPTTPPMTNPEPAQKISSAETGKLVHSSTTDHSSIEVDQADGDVGKTAVQTPSPAPVQRNAVESAAENEGRETGQAGDQAEEAIPTAIGPLPGDLWKLIGEPPPKQHQPASPVSNSAEPPPTRSGTTAGDLPMVIQREQDLTAAAPEASQSSGEQAGMEQAAESEVDIDQLAKRVYAEVRRRLSVEWERVRRR